MRRYEDPVEVRRGAVAGYTLGEAPEQFLWRGRLWKVRAVLARWVVTGAWWQSESAREVLGTDEAGPVPDDGAGARAAGDLLAERELWRVEAGDRRGAGVFDLSFDWSDGEWQLVGCLD